MRHLHKTNFLDFLFCVFLNVYELSTKTLLLPVFATIKFSKSFLECTKLVQILAFSFKLIFVTFSWLLFLYLLCVLVLRKGLLYLPYSLLSLVFLFIVCKGTSLVI